MAPEQNHHHLLATLRSYMPRAGFRWPERASVLRQERQDHAILCALRDYGGATLLRAGTRGKPRDVRHQVEQILADMFGLSTSDANAGRIDQFASELDWAADLGTRLRWADHLDEDTFLELFIRLRQARREWESNKREPFDTKKDHGALAHALDRFYQATSESLMSSLDVVFLMTQDPSIEIGAESVGDDPAVEAPHTQGMGAHAAAGEPHPQRPLTSGGAGEDEDSDVQMDDGEGDDEDGGVREVRQRLAATKLGEDMEVDQ